LAVISYGFFSSGAMDFHYAKSTTGRDKDLTTTALRNKQTQTLAETACDIKPMLASFPAAISSSLIAIEFAFEKCW